MKVTLMHGAGGEVMGELLVGSDLNLLMMEQLSRSMA
jgi:hypothetical protein